MRQHFFEKISKNQIFIFTFLGKLFLNNFCVGEKKVPLDIYIAGN